MKFFTLILCILASHAMAANILFVGDSHTAGPFGYYMKTNLAKDHNVAVYGHSSSAAIHWVGDKTHYFTGGIFHAAEYESINLTNPNPIPWREKAPTPKYKTLVENMLRYESWTQKVGAVKADIAVIALGANDSKTISTSNGMIRESSYALRQGAILNMLKIVKENEMKCIWIGPPGSEMKSPAQEDTLYSYLKEAVSEQCSFFNSRSYVAKKWLPRCDGVHFSCNEDGYKVAKKWAKAVSDFINQQIN